MKPEEFADYVRRAEKRALPTLKEKRLGPAAAQLLLAQLAQMLGGVFFVSAAVDDSTREARSENGQGGKCPITFINFAMLPSLLDCPRSASELMWAISRRFEYIWVFIPIQRLYCQFYF